MVRAHRRPIIVLLTLLLVATACGNAKSGSSDTTISKGSLPSDGGAATRTEHDPITGVPGVSDTTISYAVVGTKQNNPLGTCLLDCYLTGINAYFAYRNSQGGIFGRKLAVEQVTDDQLGSNEPVALSIISGKKAFGVFEAGLLQQGWGDLNDAGVPTYTWGIDAGSAANRDAIFPSTVIRCQDCTSRLMPYTAKLAGATKAAVLGYGTSANSKVCADSGAASLRQYQSDTGVTLAYSKDNLPYGLANGLGPEVSAMKRAGVDFIATCFDLNAMKTLAQELQRQGMSHVVLFHPNTYNQAFVKAAGTLFDGGYVEVGFRPFENSGGNVALAAFKTWMTKQHSQLTELAMVGWINASAAYDGLLAAGPHLDRAKVIAATNAITDFTAGGLVPSTNWGQAHTPYTQATRSKVDDLECGTMVKVVDSTFHNVTPTDKPWLCWKVQDPAWSQPVPTDFH